MKYYKSAQTDNTCVGLDNVNYYIKDHRRIAIRNNKKITTCGDVRDYSDHTTAQEAKDDQGGK